MTRTDQVLKWVGAATLALGVVPAAVVVLRDLPGATREVKGLKMGHRGGWSKAH